ncbi:ribonuclease HI-like [Chiloscyllium punctatum]|uniref:ribonuclease HI-like n=1 Tax=Chiloscyllium punctatum TaxID=137246 RepID=UPI003B63656F
MGASKRYPPGHIQGDPLHGQVMKMSSRVAPEQDVLNDKLETAMSKRIDRSLTAQVAELVAFTKAVEPTKGKTVNIYADSQYVSCVVHDYMVAWGRSGFTTAGGAPIRIQPLLCASEQPKEASVTKIKVHQKEPLKESPNWQKFKGNQAAD